MELNLIASNAICRNDATLLSADVTFNFLFSELERVNNHYSNSLKQLLMARITARRNAGFVDLLHYLHNPTTYDDDTTFGLRTRKTEVHKLAIKLFKRLQIQIHDMDESDDDEMPDITSAENNNRTERNKQQAEQPVDNVTEEVIVPEDEPPLLGTSLAEKLQEAIQSTMNPGIVPNELNSLTHDFKLYEAQTKRTTNLDFIYKSLLTIKPSSVEAERAFSSAGNFATRIRSRLGDKALSALVFLKNMFTKNDSV